jgi:hypothetical protein
MKDSPHVQPAGADPAGSAQDQLLSRLEQLLSEQLSLAKSEDFEAAFVTAGQISELLAKASEHPRPLSAQQAKSLSGILKLHDQLGLILAQKRHQIAQKLLHSAQGGKTLRAYRQGTV